MIGGGADVAFERAARFDGWIMGGGAPDQFAEAAEKVRAAWSEAGREGEPYLGSLAYYSLGPDAERNAEEKIGGYYKVLGDEVADMIAGSAAKDAETVAGYKAGLRGGRLPGALLLPGGRRPRAGRPARGCGRVVARDPG